MKIGIFTQYDTAFKEVADITLPVLQAYADRHGYELNVSFYAPITRSIVWDRYKILAENLHRYDWVAHFDTDVLVTNPHIRLEEFTDHGKLIVMSRARREDGTTIFNDGVAMFRNKLTCRTILEIVKDHEADILIQCGQDVFEYGPSWIREYIHVERQKAINSFLFKNYIPNGEATIGNWTPGDFVLHLPGCSNQRRVEIFGQYNIKRTDRHED